MGGTLGRVTHIRVEDSPVGVPTMEVAGGVLGSAAGQMRAELAMAHTVVVTPNFIAQSPLQPELCGVGSPQRGWGAEVSLWGRGRAARLKGNSSARCVEEFPAGRMLRGHPHPRN